MLQEPFCPPKPSMPSPAVTPSTYLDDLVKLFEVIQSLFCVFFFMENISLVYKNI